MALWTKMRPRSAEAALALALLWAGCKRAPAEAPPQRVQVVELRVADSTSEDLGPIALDELEAAAAEGLSAAGIRVRRDGSSAPAPGDFRLALELSLSHVPPSRDTDGKGMIRALVRGGLRARPAEGKAPEILRFDQDALSEKVYTGRPAAGAFAEHARRTVKDASRALGQQLALLMADEKALVATIRRRDEDADVRGVAITLSGLRRHKGAFEALVESLRDPEAAIRDKAIGALIELHDRRAVKALASSAAFSDTFELGKILEAVAALGGEEARSYLEFVASGHQDPRIRKEARVALSHLEEREKRENN